MISNKDIDDLVATVVAIAHPEKVLLFGSYALNRATEESDVDLFVVQESTLPRYKRAQQIRRALPARFPFPKDIVVYTPTEVADWKDVPGSFTATVFKEGKILYEKPE